MPYIAAPEADTLDAFLRGDPTEVARASPHFITIVSFVDGMLGASETWYRTGQGVIAHKFVCHIRDQGALC